MSLEIKGLNITLSSGDPVVENMSFQLEKDEILSIVGNSGVGKTAIRRTITGLLGNACRAKGSILFHGRELPTLPDRERRTIYRKEICLIMWSPMTTFNPSTCVGRQLGKAYRLHHSKTSRKEMYGFFSNLLQRLGPEDTTRILNSYLFTLSDGILQRLMIAAALMNKPSFLVADEATTAVDACNRIGLMRELKGFCRKEMSVLFVTHNLRSTSVSDRTLVMDHRQVVKQGAAEQILVVPPKDYTKHLLNACRLERREWT